jgi:hypothetical protein
MTLLTDEALAELAALTAEPPRGDVAYDLLAFALADKRADVSAMARELLGWREQYGSFVPEA